MRWPFRFRKWSGRGVALTSAEVRTAVQAMRPAYVFVRDSEYRAISWDDFKYLMGFLESMPKYRKNRWDCDNFAIDFMAQMNRLWNERCESDQALLFGYISGLPEVGEHHAWIWHIDDKGVIRHIEPQTNKLRTIGFKAILVET